MRKMVLRFGTWAAMLALVGVTDVMLRTRAAPDVGNAMYGLASIVIYVLLFWTAVDDVRLLALQLRESLSATEYEKACHLRGVLVSVGILFVPSGALIPWPAAEILPVFFISLYVVQGIVAAFTLIWSLSSPACRD